MTTNRAEQAVQGLGGSIVVAGGVVRVRDGNDTWLCREAAYDAAYDVLAERPAVAGDESEEGMHAYSELCAEVARRGVVVSLSGTSRGTPREQTLLVRDAVQAGLLDRDERLAVAHLGPAPTAANVAAQDELLAMADEAGEYDEDEPVRSTIDRPGVYGGRQ